MADGKEDYGADGRLGTKPPVNHAARSPYPNFNTVLPSCRLVGHLVPGHVNFPALLGLAGPGFLVDLPQLALPRLPLLPLLQVPVGVLLLSQLELQVLLLTQRSLQLQRRLFLPDRSEVISRYRLTSDLPTST